MAVGKLLVHIACMQVAVDPGVIINAEFVQRFSLFTRDIFSQRCFTMTACSCYIDGIRICKCSYAFDYKCEKCGALITTNLPDIFSNRKEMSFIKRYIFSKIMYCFMKHNCITYLWLCLKQSIPELSSKDLHQSKYVSRFTASLDLLTVPINKLLTNNVIYI